MSSDSNFTLLRGLLSSWKLLELLPVFQDEGINIEELEIMKPHHISELLRNFKMGVRIRFEHNFDKWRHSIGRPMPAVTGSYEYCSPIKYRRNSVERSNRATNTDFDDYLKYMPTSPSPSPLPALQPQQLFMELPRLTPQPRSAAADTECQRRAAASPKTETASTMIQPVEQPLVMPISLMQILQSSGPKGALLLEFAQKHERLTNTQRALLITLIVNFFESHDYHLSLNMSHNLEWQILKMFPAEKLEDFRTEKRGKIYVKFCNMKRYKRERPTTKRKWDGGVAAGLLPNVGIVDGNAEDEDDDDFTMNFDNWANQSSLLEVQVKTEDS